MIQDERGHLGDLALDKSSHFDRALSVRTPLLLIVLDRIHDTLEVLLVILRNDVQVLARDM